MYQVSEEYKVALCKSVITDRITGKITLSDGASLTITDAAVVKGSLKISHELCDSYKIGTFNLGCLKMGIYDDSALGRDFSGAVVEPIYGLKTSAGWEDVPLGIYRIDGKSVKRKRNAVYFTAYDNGTLFDCPPESWVGNNYRTPEWYMKQLCEQCGVNFGGMDEGLPNSEKKFYARGSQLQTCRDVIMWFTALMCAYAVIDRTGALRIISAKYSVSGDDATEITIDKKLTAEERKSIYVTDTRAYIKCLTAYSGLKTKSYVSSVVQTDEQAAPATYVLAKNPILSELSDSECDEINNSWLEYIDGFKQRGITAELYGDPALDVGDVMRCYGGDIDQRRSIVGLVTSQEWRYRSYHSVTCAAPDLIFDEEQTATNSVSTRSQTEKRIDATLFKIGTGLNNTDGKISLCAAGSTLSGSQTIGGVYSVGRGLEIGYISAGEIALKYAESLDPDGTWYTDSIGGIRLGEGLSNITETKKIPTRTRVDLGKGMEYEDIPIPENADKRYLDANDGEVYLYRKKIRPLLGNGLEFAEKKEKDPETEKEVVTYAIQPLLGYGLEFAEKKEKDPVTEEEVVTYAIQPLLGNGLKFDDNGALTADGTGGGGDYTAGTGIEISSDNQISLLPAGGSIGGVKAGKGVEIAADGTISVTGGADISAGGGIEITTEDEKPKIAVKCGEGCEINDSGELVTVPNIEHAIFISEADAKYLLHEYTQIEYIAGNRIGYAGASSTIIINGYTASKYVDSSSALTAPVYQSATFNRLLNPDRTNASASEIVIKAEIISTSGSGYYTELSINDDSIKKYTIDNPSDVGFELLWKGIYATKSTLSEIAPYGYAEVGIWVRLSDTSAVNYSTLYLAFASEAEYNAAVGLTYEPLTLTRVEDTTTVV